MGGDSFFSVVIPTYNRAGFLGIAVDSVLRQTFRDYELIIVDDGSTDETKTIVKNFSDKRIKYIYQENKGPSAARNIGIKQAKGEFICLLDSDDRFLSQKLEITRSCIEKHPKIKLFHSQEVWYRGNSLLSQKKHHAKPSGDAFEDCLKLCCVGASTVAIKKEVFQEIGYFDEKLLVCEDYDLWLRITVRFKIFLIPQALTIKQGGHPDQQSKKYPAMDRFRIYALEKILKSLSPESNNYKLAYDELRCKCLIYIKGSLDFRPTRNQLRDIERLIFEISRREEVSSSEIADSLKTNNFFNLKKTLIARRFPLSTKQEKIGPKKVFLSQVPSSIKNSYKLNAAFKPEKIFVEKAVRKSYLVDNFRQKFPETDIEELNHCSDYLKINKFSLSELKKPYVFIIKEKWDFLKPCPCTKHHLSCGYWILNLGFGCPYDCSYCFLQHYTNFPGIVLPGNLEDFFAKSDDFLKKVKKPIRIGTGEFCDSLALDHLTEYSLKLIPYFKKKNVYFELKTKSAAIENLLTIPGSKNIVISWSINPQDLIDSQEKGVASLEQRLQAAKRVRAAGYSLGFHFDPVIHSDDYKPLYRELINTLYKKLKPPFSWISLGTLRSNRKLKMISEQRFPKSKIFYGELFIGEDKKLRYPQFLRQEIYQNMINWIREHDTKTPLYLCMENKDLWELNKPSLSWHRDSTA